MSDQYSASCSCGAVGLTLNAAPQMAFNCHCSICRKMNGTAFSTYVVFPRAAMQTVKGEERVASTRVGQLGLKHFCRECGAPLYGLHQAHEAICLVSLGAIDGGDPVTPAANVFCDSRLPWVFELSKLQNFEQGPEGSSKGH